MGRSSAPLDAGVRAAFAIRRRAANSGVKAASISLSVLAFRIGSCTPFARAASCTSLIMRYAKPAQRPFSRLSSDPVAGKSRTMSATGPLIGMRSLARNNTTQAREPPEIKPDRVLNDLGREAMAAVAERSHADILPDAAMAPTRFP